MTGGMTMIQYLVYGSLDRDTERDATSLTPLKIRFVKREWIYG